MLIVFIIRCDPAKEYAMLVHGVFELFQGVECHALFLLIDNDISLSNILSKRRCRINRSDTALPPCTPLLAEEIGLKTTQLLHAIEQLAGKRRER